MPRARKATEYQTLVGDNLGAGADLFNRLSEAGISVLASCCYDIDGKGHLSFVPKDEKKAAILLRDLEIEHHSSDVLLIRLPNKRGALAAVLGEVAALGVQTRSAYVTPTTEKQGLVVIKTEDNPRVLEALNDKAKRKKKS